MNKKPMMSKKGFAETLIERILWAILLIAMAFAVSYMIKRIFNF